MPQPDADRPRTVSDHLVDRLGEWGVRRVFGCTDGGINGVMAGLHRAGIVADTGSGDANAPISFVQVAQVTHEELAGLMATAHAKFSGEAGVSVVTGGPA
jgi:pyruvate dehydrogenase (quinone)